MAASYPDVLVEPRWEGAVLRGLVFFAGLGCALGGLVATFDWPVVGTLFGAVPAGVVGGGIGVATALILTVVARVSESRALARAISGLLGGGTSLAIAFVWTGPIDVPAPIAVVAVAAAVLLSGAFGPMIASGVALVSDPAGSRARARRDVAAVVLGGVIVGGVAGGVVGLVLGVETYLPTAVFAVFEGAAFGVVSGTVLAVVVVGLVILPRLRAVR